MNGAGRLPLKMGLLLKKNEILKRGKNHKANSRREKGGKNQREKL